MEDLSKYVGLFVRRGNDLGMIDEVHGERLGFVWSDKTSWTGELVDEDEVTICESDKDYSAALNSARQYYSREADSLRNRLRLHLPQDCAESLQSMLSRCEFWNNKLN